VSRYAADSKDRVREAVDMVALVTPKSELRRAGVNSYFGRCPFHDERTASFHVSPDDRLYHCFGCQASGDPFNFVMETEGLDFKGALESLANRFGVKLETEDEDPEAAARRARRERLHALLDRAATYYARYLWEAREAASARDYLLGRGLTEAMLTEFRVGYAPSAWDRMLLASRRAGFTEEELLACGLAQRSHTNPGRIYDRFRSRIMFPSADVRGRICGFGARAMSDTDGDRRVAKYVNSPDSDLYHKRDQLYGIDRARGAATKADRMILVEGYTDVLALHQAGMPNAVGIMGTSFTEEQLNVLEKHVHVLELCLDSDSAGQEAVMKAADRAASRKVELRVVALPEGQDPADLMRADGADALRARVEASVPFAAFHVDRILAGTDGSSAEQRDRAISELAPVLGQVPPSVLRDELLQKVSGRLALSEVRLASLMASAEAAGPRPAATAATPAASSSEHHPPVRSLPALDQEGKAERMFLANCIAVPAAGREALAAGDLDQLLTSEPLRRAARHLAPRCEAPLSGLPTDDEQLAMVVADLVALAARVPDVSAHRVEHARLVLERARLDREIRRARGEGRMDISRLAGEREQVLAKVRAVVAGLQETV
jgi:DNA primase